MRLLFSVALSLAAAGIGTFGSARGQTYSKPFLYEQWHYEMQQQPKKPWDVVADALDNPTVAGLAKGVAAFYGVPTEAVELGTRGARAYKQGWEGEEKRPTWYPPNGYLFCNARIARQNNYIGRGSMSLTLSPGMMSSYTWLQRRDFGKGRSVFDVNVDVVYVKWELQPKYLAEKKCLPPGSLIIDVNFYESGPERYNSGPPRTEF